MLFPFLNGAAAFPAQLEQELLFLGYKKTQHLYFFWCWSCSPPISRTPNPPGFRDQIPPHPFQLWDTAIPIYLVPKIPSPWEQGIEFLRNERAPKISIFGSCPWQCPQGGQGTPWAAAGHKSNLFPSNFWSAPAPQEGIVEPSTGTRMPGRNGKRPQN